MATYDEIIAASEANKNNYGMSQEEIAKRQELIRRVAEYNPDLAATISRGPYRTNDLGSTASSKEAWSKGPSASGSNPNWKQGPSGPMSKNSPTASVPATASSGMGISDRTRGNTSTPPPSPQASSPMNLPTGAEWRANTGNPMYSQGSQPVNININMPGQQVDKPQDAGSRSPSSQPPNYGNQGQTQQPYGGGQWGMGNYLYNTMGNSLASAMGAPSPELQQQQGGNWREWMGPPPSGYDSSGWYTPQSQFQLTPEQEANRQSMYGPQPQPSQGPSGGNWQEWMRGPWVPPEQTQQYWDNQFSNDPQVRKRALQQGNSIPMYIPPYSGN